MMVAAMVTVTVLVMALIGVAEEAAINPIRVTTRQINAYGPNPIQIQSTNVTATAAELNILDGCTATYDTLNAAAGGTTATLAPTTLTVSGVTTVGKLVNSPQTLGVAAGAVTLTVTSSVVYVAGQYGVVTMTLANASSPGMYVTIVNTVATNVELAEVAGRIQMPASWGTVTNGQWDTISFTSYSTQWVCTGFSDN
jgi:hypothetical protein